MKKKVMMIGAGLTLGSALVLTSAFAGVSGSQGYDAYKEALRASSDVTNATERITLTLTDNGKELLQVNANVKNDEASQLTSATVTVENGTQTDTLQLYEVDGRAVLKTDDSDVYRVFDVTEEEENEYRWNDEQHGAISGEVETVIDAIVGNLKNNFVLEDGNDGSAVINFELSGAQIPAAANAIGSLIVKEALNAEHSPEAAAEAEELDFARNTFGIDLEQLASAMPKLTDEVSIDTFGLKAGVNAQDLIDSHELKLAISGKDEAGNKHTIVLEAEVETLERGTTKPDSIDLTGKKVEQVDVSRFE